MNRLKYKKWIQMKIKKNQIKKQIQMNFIVFRKIFKIAMKLRN